jgi:hypothetical protein
MLYCTKIQINILETDGTFKKMLRQTFLNLYKYIIGNVKYIPQENGA